MLQIIVVVRFLRKDMNDDAAVVQQHPAFAVVALGAQDVDALPSQLELRLVGQRPHVGGGRTGGNDEILGHGGQILHGQNVDVEGFFGVQRAGQTDGKFSTLHN